MKPIMSSPAVIRLFQSYKDWKEGKKQSSAGCNFPKGKRNQKGKLNKRCKGDCFFKYINHT